MSTSSSGRASGPSLDPAALDLLRDAGALCLLAAALGLRWTVPDGTTDVFWVLGSLALVAVSVAVPHLRRRGPLARLSASASLAVRWAAGVPLLVSAAVVVIDDLLHVGDPVLAPRFDEVARSGIGLAVGVSLAGLVLAAQPRHDERGTRFDALWPPLATALLVAGCAMLLVTQAIGLVRVLDQLPFDRAQVVASLAFPLALLAVLAVPALLARRDPGWWRPVAAVGLALLVLAVLFGGGRGGTVQVSAAETATSGAGLFLVLPGAAAALSAPVLGRTASDVSVEAWLRTVGRALILLAVGLALPLVDRIVLVADAEGVPASAYLQIGLLLVMVLLALIGRWLLGGADAGTLTEASAARLRVVVVLGVLLVLGAAAVLCGSRADGFPLTDVEVATWLGLTGLGLGALLVPPAVRAHFPPLVARGAAGE
ncbi:hypothetical protein K8Z61_00145 [Nocardioides sp. TRM66260-LWL]|uniref:DUF7937 domain-containing protein n=1 Tax=Nocardioides sp. TRM66260-LWL TaxID=2874478 RepID=UPI001CC540E4|nr:hypothetical protein [Nocardioides sp. TRM66260-LWL]MBZ5732897.1 hypothetical protein [Nocardioides sp. TRM66260-LWL]